MIWGTANAQGGAVVTEAAARVIVTADDYGLSRGVDDGILRSFHEGVVRSTTVLVNFPDVVESVARLPQAGLELGIHLNLTAGPPVLSPGELPSLVGRGGQFRPLASFLARAGFGRVAWAEARREWEAQIQKGLGIGCRFAFLTSHHHVHMLPPLARIAAELARAHGIPSVRLARIATPRRLPTPLFKALVLAPWARAARPVLARHRLLHNHFLLDLPHCGAAAALDWLVKVLPRVPGAVYELVCHPGYVDRTLASRDRLTLGRLADLEAVTAPAVAAVLRGAGIEVTTFGALARAAGA
jgi:chitin disaccharide deacetylase